MYLRDNDLLNHIQILRVRYQSRIINPDLIRVSGEPQCLQFLVLFLTALRGIHLELPSDTPPHFLQRTVYSGISQDVRRCMRLVLLAGAR